MRRKDITCLSSSRLSKTIFLPDKTDVSAYRPFPLAPGEFLSLDLQRDYDILGLTLDVQDTQHLWILLGGRETRLAAVRMLAPPKLPGLSVSRSGPAWARMNGYASLLTLLEAALHFRCVLSLSGSPARLSCLFIWRAQSVHKRRGQVSCRSNISLP